MTEPTDPLTLDAYWLVLWEPRYKTLKSVGQVGCVFATEKEARQMLAAWPGGAVVKAVPEWIEKVVTFEELVEEIKEIDK